MNKVKFINYDSPKHRKNASKEKFPGFGKVTKGGIWVEGTTSSGERISMPSYFYNEKWHPELFLG
jgi:hypothetical protein